MNRLMINICTADLKKSTEFFTEFLKMQVEFDSDWFVQLKANNQNLEIGLIDQNNELVPKPYQAKPNGTYLTIVVDDVDDYNKQAVTKKIEIVQAPNDTFYGQRRMLVKSPCGMLIDISSLIEANHATAR
jgi:predicted enzyme related to lactoylglutathione lyase